MPSPWPAATPAAAQRLSLSPTIGVYIPTTELVKAANGESFKQEVGLAVGGRLGVTFSPGSELETTVSYVPSDLHFNLENGTTTKTDANLPLRHRSRHRARDPHDPAGLAHPERRRAAW
jgi:hypothetical protein